MSEYYVNKKNHVTGTVFPLKNKHSLQETEDNNWAKSQSPDNVGIGITNGMTPKSNKIADPYMWHFKVLPDTRLLDPKVEASVLGGLGWAAFALQIRHLCFLISTLYNLYYKQSINEGKGHKTQTSATHYMKKKGVKHQTKRYLS